MDEDSILDIAISFLSTKGWYLAYRTRPIQDGAIAGVDAILYNPELNEFRLIDAKGESKSPPQRSTHFANCLGSLLKRIRIDSGYLHLESKALFIPLPKSPIKDFREHMRRHAVHRNCEYWLVFPFSMRQTIVDTLDPALAGILRLYILLVDEKGIATRFEW